MPHTNNTEAISMLSIYLNTETNCMFLSTTSKSHVSKSQWYPKSCNHKRIGLYYLLSTILFGTSGMMISIIMRLELDSSSNRIMCLENQYYYNLSLTLHGLLMIFFLIMPGIFGGIGNSFVPIYLATSEVTYPRINNISVIIVPLSYTLVLLSMNTEFGNGTGWTLYPPLSTTLMSLSKVSMNLICYGLLLSGLSSSLTSLNILITLNIMKYSTLSNMPMYVWSIVIITSILLLVLPILTATLLMMLTDLHYNTVFFDPLFGGDPVFYQHLFWFFGHPEVYILILPTFGLISNILSGLIQVILFGNWWMILAMSCISLLGTLVWAHHMFLIGMESDTRAYFMSITMIISLPTGSKIFNWWCTYLGTNASLLQVRTNTFLFVLWFMLMFTIGGSTGVILGNIILDICLHDSYYVVTHFHFVLSLGSMFAIMSSISFYQDQLLHSQGCYIQYQGSLQGSLPTVTSLISRYHLYVIYVGILLSFVPMHLLGFNVMPRRIWSYPDLVYIWNCMWSVGSIISLISFFVLCLMLRCVLFLWYDA